MAFDLSIPGALAVFRRNFLVWRRLFWPALVMNLGEPALYLLGLGLGLGTFVGTLDGLSYLAFLASGLVASSAMNTATFEGMYSVYTRMVPQKTYEAMLATPLQIQDILLGEMLWCAAKSAFSAAGILLVAALLGVVHGFSALWALPAAFLTGLAFAGPAIVMSARASNYDFFNYYFVLVITPMLLVCGVFYPVDTLPEAMRALVDWLPLTHAVELIRPLIVGTEPARPLLNLAVLAAFAAASFALAVILARRRLVH
ncbi:ABC transporter permease [Thiofaba sp. EF100]|uniref:ABC transporter permease n=1 Tax=Thiofaba sp. EF100 TaxID=3121274 RepID=UPI0032219352